MSNYLDVTHIGEPLVASLLQSDCSCLNRLFKEVDFSGKWKIIPNQKIIIKYKYKGEPITAKADPLAQIDVAIYNEIGNECYAIELKLGKRVNSALINKFFAAKIAFTQENKKLLKGNMLPILRHIPGDISDENITEVKVFADLDCGMKPCPVKAFAMIVRSQAILEKLSFEFPVVALSALFTKEQINNAVAGLIINRDFFGEWGLGKGTPK